MWPITKLVHRNRPAKRRSSSRLKGAKYLAVIDAVSHVRCRSISVCTDSLQYPAPQAPQYPCLASQCADSPPAGPESILSCFRACDGQPCWRMATSPRPGSPPVNSVASRATSPLQEGRATRMARSPPINMRSTALCSLCAVLLCPPFINWLCGSAWPFR